MPIIIDAPNYSAPLSAINEQSTFFSKLCTPGYDFFKTPSTPPASEASRHILGLHINKPQESPQDKLMLDIAAVTNDTLNWQEATQNWENNYIQKYRGAAARNATEETLAFHKKFYTTLREKYSGNPDCLTYLNNYGNTLANRSLDYMHGYAQEENAACIDAALQKEEEALYSLGTSPWSTLDQRQKALASYTLKASFVRSKRGESQEDIQK